MCREGHLLVFESDQGGAHYAIYLICGDSWPDGSMRLIQDGPGYVACSPCALNLLCCPDGHCTSTCKSIAITESFNRHSMQPGWLHKLNMEVVHGSTEQVHHNGSGPLLPGIIIMILRECGQEVKLVNHLLHICLLEMQLYRAGGDQIQDSKEWALAVEPTHALLFAFHLADGDACVCIVRP